MSLEALEDLLCYNGLNIKIDNVAMEDSQHLRLELSGDGLSVVDGSVGQKVKSQHGPDTTKPYYRMKSKVVKIHDNF